MYKMHKNESHICKATQKSIAIGDGGGKYSGKTAETDFQVVIKMEK